MARSGKLSQVISLNIETAQAIKAVADLTGSMTKGFTAAFSSLSSNMNGMLKTIEQISKKLEDASTRFVTKPTEMNAELSKNILRNKTSTQQQNMAGMATGSVAQNNIVRGVDAMTAYTQNMNAFWTSIYTKVKGGGIYKDSSLASSALRSLNSVEKFMANTGQADQAAMFKQLNGKNGAVQRASDAFRVMLESQNKVATGENAKKLLGFYLTGDYMAPDELNKRLKTAGAAVFKDRGAKPAWDAYAKEKFVDPSIDSSAYVSRLYKQVQAVIKDSNRPIEERIDFLKSRLGKDANVGVTSENNEDGSIKQTITYARKALHEFIRKEAQNAQAQVNRSIAEVSAQGTLSWQNNSGKISGHDSSSVAAFQARYITPTDAQPIGISWFETMRMKMLNFMKIDPGVDAKISKAKHDANENVINAIDALGYRLITISYMFQKMNMMIDNAMQVMETATTTRQTAMGRIQPILRNDTGKFGYEGSMAETQRYQAGLEAIARRTGQSFETLSRALYDASSAFPYAADKLAVLNVSSRLSAVGFANTERAMESMIAVMKTFYADVEGSPEQFDAALRRVANMAMTATDLGVLEINELSVSMQNMAPSASMLGLSMDEMYASLAATSGVVGSASRAATKLNQLFMALAMPPTSTLRDYYAQMGVTGRQFIEQSGGLIQALTKINEAAGGSGVGANFEAGPQLRQYLGRAQATQATNALMSSVESFNDTTYAIQNNFLALNNAFYQARFGVAEYTNELNIAKQETERINARFGEAMLPARIWLNKLTNSFREAFMGLAGGIVPYMMVAGANVAKVAAGLMAFVGGLFLALRALSQFSYETTKAMLITKMKSATGADPLNITEQLLGGRNQLVARGVNGSTMAAYALTSTGMLVTLGVIAGAVLLISAATAYIMKYYEDEKKKRVRESRRVLSMNMGGELGQIQRQIVVANQSIQTGTTQVQRDASRGALDFIGDQLDTKIQTVERWNEIAEQYAGPDLKVLASLVTTEASRAGNILTDRSTGPLDTQSTYARAVGLITDYSEATTNALANFARNATRPDRTDSASSLMGEFSLANTPNRSQRTYQANAQVGPDGTIVSLRGTAYNTAHAGADVVLSPESIAAFAQAMLDVGNTDNTLGEILDQFRAGRIDETEMQSQIDFYLQGLKDLQAQTVEFATGTTSAEDFSDAIDDLDTSFRTNVQNLMVRYNAARQDNNAEQMFNINSELNSAIAGYLDDVTTKGLEAGLGKVAIEALRARKLGSSTGTIRAAKTSYLNPEFQEEVTTVLDTMSVIQNDLVGYRVNIQNASESSGVYSELLMDSNVHQNQLNSLEGGVLLAALTQYANTTTETTAAFDAVKKSIAKIRLDAFQESVGNASLALRRAAETAMLALGDPGTSMAGRISARGTITSAFTNGAVADLPAAEVFKMLSELVEEETALVSAWTTSRPADETMVAFSPQAIKLLAPLTQNWQDMVDYATQANSGQGGTIAGMRASGAALTYSSGGKTPQTEAQLNEMLAGLNMNLSGDREVAQSMKDSFYVFRQATKQLQDSTRDMTNSFRNSNTTQAEAYERQIEELRTKIAEDSLYAAEDDIGREAIALAEEQIRILEGMARYERAAALTNPNYNAFEQWLRKGAPGLTPTEQAGPRQPFTWESIGVGLKSFIDGIRGIPADLIKGLEDWEKGLREGVADFYTKNGIPGNKLDAEGNPTGEFQQVPLGDMAEGLGNAAEGGIDELLKGLADGLSAAGGVLMAFLMALQKVRSLMILLGGPVQWLAVIFEVAVAWLKPAIDSVLAPFVGILVVLGQVLGAVLLPLVMAFMPVFLALAQLFVMVYNLLLPVFNVLVTIFTVIGNVVFNVMLAFMQVLAWVATLPFMADTMTEADRARWNNTQAKRWDAGVKDAQLQPIVLGQVTEAGATYLANEGGAGSTGGSAEATRMPDQYFNFYIGADAITDIDGGKIVSVDYILDVFEARMAEQARAMG